MEATQLLMRSLLSVAAESLPACTLTSVSPLPSLPSSRPPASFCYELPDRGEGEVSVCVCQCIAHYGLCLECRYSSIKDKHRLYLVVEQLADAREEERQVGRLQGLPGSLSRPVHCLM